MESHSMLPSLSGKMFARASWKPVSRLETKSACSRPLPLLECRSNSCNHPCSSVQANSLPSCLREPPDVVCHSLLSQLWLCLVLRERDLLSLQVSHSKAAVALLD